MIRSPRVSALGVVTAAAVIAAGVSACGGSSSSGGSSGGQAASAASVSIAFPYDPAPFGYDPAVHSGGGITTFWEGLYSTLLTASPNGTVEPGLATSFKFNADKTVLTLTLRQGVKFTDGTTLTSTLVMENLDRRSNPTLGAYAEFGPGGSAEISNVSAPNPSTVVITFAKPEASAPSLLGDDSGWIVGGKAIANPKMLLTTPDGSGPYTLSSGVVGSSYTFAKNKNAWDASSYPFQTVTIKVFTDTQSVANALVSGQVQVAQLDPTTLSLVQGREGVVGFSGAEYGFLLFDKLGKISKPFGNPQVMQALAMSIDRAAIAKLHPGAVATASYFPPGTPGYNASMETTYAYNPTKAKQLLAQAGYPNGFSFTILVAGTSFDLDLQAVQQNWQAIGVKMNIDHTTDVLNAPTTTPLGYFEFSLGKDPLGWVTGFLLSGGTNPQHATNPVIDSALQAAESGTGDTDYPALQTLNAAIVSQGWSIPVYSQPAYVGYSKSAVAAPTASPGTIYPMLSSIVPAGQS